MKIIVIIVILAAVLFLAMVSPALLKGIFDFRTDSLEQETAITTPIGVTSANITLLHTLWDGDITYASVSSSNASDAPAPLSYTAANKRLVVNGLSDNTTRVLTVIYKTDGLGDYTGTGDAVKYWPVAFVFALIVIPLALIVWGFKQ